MRGFEAFDGIYLHRAAVDMRKSINGLSIIVSEEMELDLFGRYLFVFCNRRKNKLKVLYWDETGFALWYKRLEKDRFRWPLKAADEVITLSAEQLQWLLTGYDILKLKPHKRLQYQRIS
jgi:transposase